MQRPALLYDDIFLQHRMPQGHPERAERLTAIIERLRASELWNKLTHMKPRKATKEELEAVHTSKHIDNITRLKGYADPDTYVSETSCEAALYAAGAVMTAIESCRSGEINRAFCALRPPGHHAEAGHAMGFCLFNNVAVGARHAQRLGYRKVFIIDFDVHHGNGTQNLFYSDPDVFYFSSHQWPHYPGSGATEQRGEGPGLDTTANYPMQAGSGDREYYSIYHDILPQKMNSFSPDIILVSAGYDIHVRDPLASIRVTAEGVGVIVESIITSSKVPVVFALEGGYDLEALAESVYVTIKKLCEIP